MHFPLCCIQYPISTIVNLIRPLIKFPKFAPSAQVGGEPGRWVGETSDLLSWHEWAVGWRAGDEGDGRGHMADVSLTHSLTFRLGPWKFDTLKSKVAYAHTHTHSHDKNIV